MFWEWGGKTVSPLPTCPLHPRRHSNHLSLTTFHFLVRPVHSHAEVGSVLLTHQSGALFVVSGLLFPYFAGRILYPHAQEFCVIFPHAGGESCLFSRAGFVLVWDSRRAVVCSFPSTFFSCMFLSPTGMVVLFAYVFVGCGIQLRFGTLCICSEPLYVMICV